MEHDYLNIQGQGLVEYALIISLVVVVVLVALAILGPALRDYYATIIPMI